MLAQIDAGRFSEATLFIYRCLRKCIVDCLVR
jgi:hypothetical protein